MNLATRAIGAIGVVGAGASIIALQPPLRWLFGLACLAVVALVLVCEVGAHLNLRYAPSILQACRALGILRIRPKGTGGETTSSRLKAASEIRLMAVSGQHFIKVHKEEIAHALSNNRATLRVLLAQPFSQFVRDVEESESPNRVDQISPEIEQTERLLVEYLTEAQRRSRSGWDVGQVWLGYYITDLRVSLILCDQDWGWLTLSLPPKGAVQAASFELGRADGGLLADAIAHFDRTWELSRAKYLVKKLDPGRPPSSGVEPATR